SARAKTFVPPPGRAPSGTPSGRPFSTSLITPSPPNATTASPPRAASSVACPCISVRSVSTSPARARTAATSDNARSLTREANGFAISRTSATRRRVAAHSVDEQLEEAVRELVGVAAGLQPRVRPVGGREEGERGGVHVEVGPELALLDAVPEEPTDALLVAPAFRDELLAALTPQIAPFANEDRGDVELLGDDTQVRAQGGADPLDRAQRLGYLVERSVERLGALARDLLQQVGLRSDVRVQRALLHAHRRREVLHRRAVVPLLCEEPGRLARQLVSPGRHVGYPTDR